MTERRLGPGLPIFILLAGSIIPAVAEMQILESNVPQFKIGERIADANELALPAGGRVKVLSLRANETRVFHAAQKEDVKDIPFGGTRGAPKKSRE
jgi:hypothetical protein